MPGTPYAAVGDLSVPEAALTDYSTAQLNDFILKASNLADGYLLGRYQLPLLEWGEDLRLHVAAIATYLAMSKRGYMPGGEDSSDIRDRYKDALSWLENVARGRVSPTLLKDSGTGQNATVSSGEALQAPYVVQAYPGGESRGDGFWGHPGGRYGAVVGIGRSRKRGW